MLSSICHFQAHAPPAQVRALADLMVERPGRLVVFCKSGMRSALLWGAAAMAEGRSPEEVMAAAQRAGHDLVPVQEIMIGLAQSARR